MMEMDDVEDVVPSQPPKVKEGEEEDKIEQLTDEVPPTTVIPDSPPPEYTRDAPEQTGVEPRQHVDPQVAPFYQHESQDDQLTKQQFGIEDEEDTDPGDVDEEAEQVEVPPTSAPFSSQQQSAVVASGLVDEDDDDVLGQSADALEHKPIAVQPPPELETDDEQERVVQVEDDAEDTDEGGYFAVPGAGSAAMNGGGGDGGDAVEMMEDEHRMQNTAAKLSVSGPTDTDLVAQPPQQRGPLDRIGSIEGAAQPPPAATRESEEQEEESDDEVQPPGIPLEGSYNSADYVDLPVSTEVKELFQFIDAYAPQTVEIEPQLKPFILDYIPAVGDIDAFIKIPRPDGTEDHLGLVVLDEPCAKQSDPTILNLQLRTIAPPKPVSTENDQIQGAGASTEETAGVSVTGASMGAAELARDREVIVKKLGRADKNVKEVEQWISSLTELHKSKPPTTVHYQRPMPDIDTLMQEWPPEFEDMLKKTELPSADMDMSLESYVDVICGLLDIPVNKSRVHSLHVLFTLYSEFKNSQHFRALAEENQLDNDLVTKTADRADEADHLVL